MKREPGMSVNCRYWITALIAAFACEGWTGTYYYYVDVKAPAGGTGVSGAPWQTLSNAVTAANAIAGDHTFNVYMATGTYADAASGGLEDFSVTNGYTLLANAANNPSARKVNVLGGYIGKTESSYDWATRALGETVVDLQNASARALTVVNKNSLTLDGLTFRNASITGSGGVLNFNTTYPGGVLTVTACAFSNNAATVSGGAILANIGENSPTWMTNLFLGNTSASGGAMHYYGNSGRAITFQSCSFVSNSATAGNGGALRLTDNYGNGNFIGCVFQRNTASGNGGALYRLSANDADQFSFTRCTFMFNTAATNGSAAFVEKFGKQYFVNCLIASNTALAVPGPGFAVSTVAGSGGSVGGLLSAAFCTIANNAGGGLYAQNSATSKDADLEVRNCIVANNGTVGIRTDDPVPLCDYNDVTGHTTSNYWALSAGTGSFSLDPLFADAAGGDFRLAKSSPCFDSAANLGVSVDLDGVPRPIRFGYDLGCYEEWQIPVLTNRAVVANSTSAEVRAQFMYENTSIVTYAWFVLDTSDKGTNMAAWGAASNSGPQAQGGIFGMTFDGLSPETTYRYRCVASNEYDIFWGEASSFRTPAAGGVTRLWTGANTNHLASYGGNWQGGVAPGSTDYVLLDAAATNLIWDAAATPTVARWTQTENYSGIVTVETVYGSSGFTVFTVTGDCIVNGGTLTHRINSSTPQYRLKMSVGGDLRVGPLGRISGQGIGYPNGSGPGPAIYQVSGASHGGQGSRYTNALGITYGSITEPVALGSGGTVGGVNDGHGGGALYVLVSGLTTVDGTLDANANPSSSSASAGAGGSVFLKTGYLSGSGRLYANGDKMGGGGRVAVILTGSNSFGNVIIHALGGADPNHPGSAGTVYKQVQGQADGTGTLVIDNNNQSSVNFGSPIFAYASALMPLASSWNSAVNLNAFSEIIVTNKGILGINGDTSLTWSSAPFRFAGVSASYVSVASTNNLVLPANLVVSNYTLLVDTPLALAANWTIVSNGVVACLSPNYRVERPLILSLTGNLTIDAGGSISLEGAGFRNEAGPGVGAWSPNRGGSYGGQGGVASWLPGMTYGSFLAPTNFGSGGSSGGQNLADGGGALRLLVSGICTVNGTINANAKPGYSGSGGSIYLTAGSLSGSGLLTASGATGASGGGGRIAVILTNGTDFGSVAMRAWGGTTPAAAGTVYRQTMDEAGGRGVLTIDNNGTTSTTNSVTPLVPGLYAITGELANATVVVTNKARVTLPVNATVGNLYVTGSTDTYLDLRSNTLRVKSNVHPLGGGSVLNYGQIIWLPKGSLILIR